MSKKHKGREDKSLRVTQNPKVKETFDIRSFQWTKKQQEVIDVSQDKETSIIIIDGPAGSGKSLLSIYCSLLLLRDKKISDITYLRSSIQSYDGQLGYLAGNVSEKTQFFNIPFEDKLNELITRPVIDHLTKENRLQTLPTAMLRGLQFNAKAWTLDESQNCTLDTLTTVMTRTGKFSKLFLLGDTSGLQNDLGNKSGFAKICSIFNDEESRLNGIRFFKFTSADIMRSGVVKFIVERLESLKTAKQNN